MRVYLDMCCLKRPFDDAGVPRNRIEAEAVLSIQKAIESGSLEFVRSPTHDVENSQNPNAVRRERVDRWLSRHPLPDEIPNALADRSLELTAAGFGPFDARHIAWAESSAADCFVTTDDRILKLAGRQPSRLKVRVLGPLDFVQEVTL